MEAEKQQMAEDLKAVLPPNPVIVSADQTVEAYKSQLKKLIEEAIDQAEKDRDEYRPGTEQHAQMIGIIQGLSMALEFTETTQPPQP